MTQPRKVYPGQTVQLVRRTLRRTFLLRPDLDLNQLMLYLVALFAQRFGVQVCALQVLSDHYHMVLTDVVGRLPDFMRELNRILALCVKVLRKWEGPSGSLQGPASSSWSPQQPRRRPWSTPGST